MATLAINGVAMNGHANGQKSSFDADAYVEGVIKTVSQRNRGETEFIQAVEEVLRSLKPVIKAKPQYAVVLERLCEPERQIIFRVPWTDDAGNVRINRGFRVQLSSAIGPYKGGLRFHPTVTLSIMKFLAFEQCFKNALTGLPMGAGKGGSDFDPKGKSDAEVLRFCQSFMTELSRHIGSTTDVPAGDIGVGGREIGYLFGQYKRLQNCFSGVLTGKAMEWGGSNIRPEATGYGAVYYGLQILADRGDDVKGKRCLISGSGNVAQYAAEKLLQLGGVVLTLSDSSGYVYEPAGFSAEQLRQVMDIKNVRRTSLAAYSSPSGVYVPGQRAWAVDARADIALPCATQNEVELADAAALAAKGVTIVLEGANMPTTNEAIEYFHGHGVVLAAAKAANAGGVAVSGLEMAQNAGMVQWDGPAVDERLKGIMRSIYAASSGAAKEYGVTLQEGANIAGFEKVARAMLAQGVV